MDFFSSSLLEKWMNYGSLKCQTPDVEFKAEFEVKIDSRSYTKSQAPNLNKNVWFTNQTNFWYYCCHHHHIPNLWEFSLPIVYHTGFYDDFKILIFCPLHPSSKINKKSKNANILYNMFSETSENQIYNGVSYLIQ